MVRRSILLLVLGLFSISGWNAAARADNPAPPPKSASRSPDEPLAKTFSLDQAAAFLDSTSLAWTRERKCGTCHTNYPYLWARPVLKGKSAALQEVRKFFEDRAAHWDKAKPRWDAEVVSTAAALAINDASSTGKLHPLSRQALDRIWTLQKPDGGWNWLKCNWPPYEHDDYFGALVAALGTAHAGKDYQETKTARAGLEKLRRYFKSNPPPSLHHQAMLMWASQKLEGLMPESEKQATVKKLLDLQRPDGGWNLASLGGWKRHNGKPNDPAGPADGYGTGLVVFVLRQAGVPARDDHLRRGLAWLKANQRASGGWFTRSPSNDRHHFISHAGTAFAVLALRSCETTTDQPDNSDKSPTR
jgi:squalene-hopene/tetraprenyl-beta-curcumene cyclase